MIETIDAMLTRTVKHGGRVPPIGRGGDFDTTCHALVTVARKQHGDALGRWRIVDERDGGFRAYLVEVGA